MKYRVVDRVDVNGIPQKDDGFQYTIASYLDVIQNHVPGHNPDLVDYWKIVKGYRLIERVMKNEIDEVWMFGGPFFGFYESRMVNKGAFWTNSPALENSDSCTRRFIIMGYNYERTVGEMIHDIGHRTESIMAQVFGSQDLLFAAFGALAPNADLSKFNHPKDSFERFITFDKMNPRQAQVGLVHFPPNAEHDYDWGNARMVTSACDDWLNFPNLLGTTRMVNCNDWGNGDTRLHHRWWFKRIPHVQGNQNGISNNWWKYIMDPNNV